MFLASCLARYFAPRTPIPLAPASLVSRTGRAPPSAPSLRRLRRLPWLSVRTPVSPRYSRMRDSEATRNPARAQRSGHVIALRYPSAGLARRTTWCNRPGIESCDWCSFFLDSGNFCDTKPEGWYTLKLFVSKHRARRKRKETRSGSAIEWGIIMFCSKIKRHDYTAIDGHFVVCSVRAR